MNRAAWLKVWCTTLVALSTNAVAKRLLHPHRDAVEPFGSFNDNKRLMATTEIQPRIVGGATTKLNEFPYFAQWAGYYKEGSTTYFGSCGASLIHADILLTAAHCNDFVDRVRAVVGSYYQLSSEEGYLCNVTGRSIHPSYSGPPNYAYDFLVLKLDTPVPIPAVTLNSNSSTPLINERITIIGLGTTRSGGTSPHSLLKVNVNYVDPVTCYNAYRKLSPPVLLNKSLHLCDGVPGGGKDACQGDSGGPVLNAKGVQVGVVSSGDGCALAGYPGVNARVSSGHAWIQQQVCKLSAYPPQFCFKNKKRTPTRVRLDVFFDSNPTVEKLTIYDSYTKVYTAGPGKTNDRNKLVSWNLSFQPGYYYIQLSKAFCCSQNDRFVAAYALVNGRYVPITGPGYAYYEGINSNYSMPVPVATSTRVSYTGQGTSILVEVSYDKYPVETSFAIYNSKNQVVFSSGLGKAEFAYKLIPYKTALVAGNYSIKIGDTFKDGFCCSKGIGYIQVSALKKDGSYRVLIPPTYGVFSAAVKSIPFRVPAPTRRLKESSSFTEQSMLPPASYSILSDFCQDSGLEFSYNASVNGHATAGTQTCQWLATQPDLKKVVCQPHQQAYKTCPKTCGKCVNECEGQDDATAIFEVEQATHDCAWLSAHSEYWLTACVPGLTAYSACKDVCNSCDRQAEGS